MQITANQVKAISLNYGKPEICEIVADFITNKGPRFQLENSTRIKHFLGQTCIESAFFARLEESLYYSADRLIAVWPNRFNKSNANLYAKNPQKLANFTYGGRLGNTGPNDGWLYRGSGIKQMTGKDNFLAFTNWMRGIDPNCPDFVANPDLARTLDWCIWSAVWYWTTRNCAHFADRDDIKGLTRTINGGLNGLDDRIKATAVAAKVLNIQNNPVVTTVKPNTPDPQLKEYQEKLVKLSVAMKNPKLNPGTPDGWNGANTKAAVEEVQRLTKLNVDGKCGPNTRKAINLLCQKYGIAV